MKLRERKNKVLFPILIGFLILIIGISVFSYHKIEIDNIDEVNSESLNAYFNGYAQIESNNKESKSSTSITKYMAVIEIPKIHLKQGIPEKNSKANNVDYNIKVIKESDTPNVENGVFILASHSGTSHISYFKNLYKLKQNDKIYIYYNDTKYVYIIDNIKDVKKDGTLKVERDTSKTTLILVTCTKNSNTKQTVYTAYLERKGE